MTGPDPKDILAEHVMAAMQGDHEALVAVYASVVPATTKYVRGSVRGIGEADADLITREVLDAQLPTCRDPFALGALVGRIAKQKAIKHVRERGGTVRRSMSQAQRAERDAAKARALAEARVIDGVTRLGFVPGFGGGAVNDKDGATVKTSSPIRRHPHHKIPAELLGDDEVSDACHEYLLAHVVAPIARRIEMATRELTTAATRDGRLVVDPDGTARLRPASKVSRVGGTSIAANRDVTIAYLSRAWALTPADIGQAHATSSVIAGLLGRSPSAADCHTALSRTAHLEIDPSPLLAVPRTAQNR